MSSRRTAGFVSAFYNPLQVPNSPTGVSATSGDTEATVSFTAPTNTGGGSITGYGAVAIGTNISSTNTSSPITLTGLTNGTTYTIGVWALNSYGPSPFGTSGSVTPTLVPRGIFFGGSSPIVNVIQYITISTTGNATDFGDLTFGSISMAACGSSTRGIKAGGYNDGFSSVNVIEYITFNTLGNSIDFGDLTTARALVAGCNSATRGVFGGGTASSNVIDYITIASIGNATDFGDLTQSRNQLASCSSSTRGIWAGGLASSASNVIDYVTIASVGNATDFGDLLIANEGGFAGCSSSTRGVFAGGVESGVRTNAIQYITIASTGNATDFGDLTEKPNNNAGFSSATRGVFGGGEKIDPAPSGKTNVITYITIASTGNATDFGDLTSALDSLAGCSNDNGGLQ